MPNGGRTKKLQVGTKFVLQTMSTRVGPLSLTARWNSSCSHQTLGNRLFFLRYAFLRHLYYATMHMAYMQIVYVYA